MSNFSNSKRITLFLLIALTFFSFRGYLQIESKKEHLAAQNVWSIQTEINNSLFKESFKPYALPEDHTVKKFLDQVFSDSRPIANSVAMKKAGFSIPADKEQDLIVAYHPQIEGYVIKYYYDNHNINEAPYWLLRMKGLARVEKAIDKFGYGDIMKAPKKWVYEIPNTDKVVANEGVYPKKYLIVAEDMQVVSRKENDRLYKEELTAQQMKAIYDVLKETWLYDCVYVDNIPFSKDGKITFVDTEDFDRKPIKFKFMASAFPEKLQTYWKELTKNESK